MLLTECQEKRLRIRREGPTRQPDTEHQVLAIWQGIKTTDAMGRANAQKTDKPNTAA